MRIIDAQDLRRALRHLSQVLSERAHLCMQVGNGGRESLEESQKRGRLYQFLRRILWRYLRRILWRTLRRGLRRWGIEIAGSDEGLTAEAVLGVEG
jgi:hypothetical protein